MKKPIILMIAIFATGASLHAADYTLEDCFSAALKNDYSLSILKDELAKKLLDRKDALSSFYPIIGTAGSIQYKSEAPTLDLSTLGMPAGGTAELGTNFIYDFNINMNQMIFDGFSRKYALLLADNSFNHKRREKELKEDMIQQTILQLSYSYTLSKLNIETLSTSMKRLDFNLNQIKLFVDQGFSSELDLLDIQSKLKELEQQKLNLESGRRKILLQISELSGITDLDTLTISSKYLELLDPEKLGGLEGKLEANGQLSLFNFSSRQIELKKKIDEAAYYPSVSGTGALHYGLPGTNLTGAEWQFYITAGLQIKFNLWEGGRRSSMVKRDDLSLSQNSKSRDNYSKTLYFDTMEKLDELISIRDQRTEALDIYNLKKKKYEIVGKLWKAGQKATLDVLSSEQEFTESDIREKSLRIKYLSLYQQILFNINEPMWENNGGMIKDE
ncbi:MAG: TolC family protein [Spirochaetaceae bacterium]|nr:TolC family protein [Spirochaetaceae bacterium]